MSHVRHPLPGVRNPSWDYARGGLMRCCIKTLFRVHEIHHPHLPSQEISIDCDLCSTQMVFSDGVWDRDKSRQSRPPVPPEAELA